MFVPFGLLSGEKVLNVAVINTQAELSGDNDTQSERESEQERERTQCKCLVVEHINAVHAVCFSSLTYSIRLQPFVKNQTRDWCEMCDGLSCLSKTSEHSLGNNYW